MYKHVQSQRTFWWLLTYFENIYAPQPWNSHVKSKLKGGIEGTFTGDTSKTLQHCNKVNIPSISPKQWQQMTDDTLLLSPRQSALMFPVQSPQWPVFPMEAIPGCKSGRWQRYHLAYSMYSKVNIIWQRADPRGSKCTQAAPASPSAASKPSVPVSNSSFCV